MACRSGIVALAALHLAGCAAPAGDLANATTGTGLTRTEASYIQQTARTLYPGRQMQRSRNFIAAPQGENAVCIRAPADTGFDYTLMVLQRRIMDDYIPQAADDILILRTEAEVRPCRDRAGSDSFWIALG